MALRLTGSDCDRGDCQTPGPGSTKRTRSRSLALTTAPMHKTVACSGLALCSRGHVGEADGILSRRRPNAPGLPPPSGVIPELSGSRRSSAPTRPSCDTSNPRSQIPGFAPRSRREEEPRPVPEPDNQHGPGDRSHVRDQDHENWPLSRPVPRDPVELPGESREHQPAIATTSTARSTRSQPRAVVTLTS